MDLILAKAKILFIEYVFQICSPFFQINPKEAFMQNLESLGKIILHIFMIPAK